MTNNIHTYWQRPPCEQRTIIALIEEQCEAGESEQKRVKGASP